MNIAYLKVTCGLRFHLFFFLLMSFQGIVVHQLWSSAFSRKHEARAFAGAGMTRHVFFFFFEQLGWCPPGTWCPTQTVAVLISSTISFISHRPDCKGTLASDLKWAGAWAPPLCRPLPPTCLYNPLYSVFSLASHAGWTSGVWRCCLHS